MWNNNLRERKLSFYVFFLFLFYEEAKKFYPTLKTWPNCILDRLPLEGSSPYNRKIPVPHL